MRFKFSDSNTFDIRFLTDFIIPFYQLLRIKLFQDIQIFPYKGVNNVAAMCMHIAQGLLQETNMQLIYSHQRPSER